MAKEATIAREGKVNPLNAEGLAQRAFHRTGTTRIGDYEIEVRNIVGQDRSRRGMLVNASTYTEIRKNGRAVAWNNTLRGGDRLREAWIEEQRRKFNI